MSHAGDHPGRGDGRRAGDAAHQAVHARPGRGRGVAALLGGQPRDRRPAPQGPDVPQPVLADGLAAGPRAATRSRCAATTTAGAARSSCTSR